MGDLADEYYRGLGLSPMPSPTEPVDRAALERDIEATKARIFERWSVAAGFDQLGLVGVSEPSIISPFAMIATFATPKPVTLSRAEALRWLRACGFIPPSKPRYRSRLRGKGRHRRRRVVVGLVRGR